MDSPAGVSGDGGAGQIGLMFVDSEKAEQALLTLSENASSEMIGSPILEDRYDMFRVRSAAALREPPATHTQYLRTGSSAVQTIAH